MTMIDEPAGRSRRDKPTGSLPRTRLRSVAKQVPKVTNQFVQHALTAVQQDLLWAQQGFDASGAWPQQSLALAQQSAPERQQAWAPLQHDLALAQQSLPLAQQPSFSLVAQQANFLAQQASFFAQQSWAAGLLSAPVKPGRTRNAARVTPPHSFVNMVISRILRARE
jgi:hypothetical protein